VNAPFSTSAIRFAIGALLAVGFTAGTSHASLGDTQPRLEYVAPEVLERLEAAPTPEGQPIEEDLHALAESRAHQQRIEALGSTADNRSCHYARGSTLIMHVFIDWPAATWSAAERAEAGGKAHVAKDFYLDHAPAAANLSFDNEETAAFWFVSAYHPVAIDTMDTAIMESVVASLGVIDADGDTSRLDDYSLGLQNWNGGWDNVMLVFQPANSHGRAWAAGWASVTALYGNSAWNVWAHEWGHLFGACDEYEEDGECGGGVNCGACMSHYLDEVYDNGNCELECGAGAVCVMKHNSEAVCPYTWQLWSWEDEDGNGQLDWVKRIGLFGSEYDIMEMWSNGYFHHSTETDGFAAHVNTPGWTVFGLRSPSTTDFDLRLFGDNNWTYPYASSEWAGQNVDFIVGDYHLNRLGVEHVMADWYSGLPGTYNIVWEGGGETLHPDGVARSQNWIAENVVRAYDVPLFAGETITFDLDVTSGGLDVGMALYSSFGTVFFAGRSAALWSRDIQGSGGTEIYTYEVPSTDVYGLVVWTNAAAAGTFQVRIGPTPATLPEQTPFFSGLDLRLYNYDPTVPYWAVVASRPGAAGDISLRLCSDAEYEFTSAVSDQPSGELELVAVNYAEAAINRDHLRIVNDNGTTFRTEWEQSADVSTGFTNGNWSSTHVATVWDVYLEEDQTYVFREYHPVWSGALNTGLYLFDPGRDAALSKAQAAAFSDTYASSQGERFTYTAATTGFHGLTLTMNNEATDAYSIWWGPHYMMQDD
jgi:hypothetical protein